MAEDKETHQDKNEIDIYVITTGKKLITKRERDSAHRKGKL